MSQTKKQEYIEKIREAKIVLAYRETNRRRYFIQQIKDYTKLLNELENN